MTNTELKEIRDRFFSSTPALPRESAKLGDVDVDIVGLSVGARSRLMKKCLIVSDDRDEDGDPVQTMDQELLQTTLVIECVCLPGTTYKLFTELDRETLDSYPAGFFDGIIKKASMLSGLNASAKADAKGN